MKKKIALMLTVVLAMGLFAGCGEDTNTPGESSTENTQSSSDVNNTVDANSTDNNVENSGDIMDLEDLNASDYVTLGDYKGLQVTVAPVEITPEEQAAYVQSIYQSYATEENGIKDRAVAVGDLINLDYSGKKGEEVFEGGTAADQSLEIGSGSFIPGFEDGLVGVMPGETVDLNLTFPENYGNADLAGQAVVFTCTVNYIYPTEFSDDEIASWGNKQFSNVAEVEQFAFDYLNETAQSNYEYEVENKILEAFMKNCTFNEVPEALTNKYRESLTINMQSQAAMYGMDADTLCYYFYGMDLAGFLDTYAVESAKQMLAFQALADKEGLNMSDEELDKTLGEFAAQNGVTVEEFIGTNKREDYKEYYMFEDVMDMLVENAVVSAQ